MSLTKDQASAVIGKYGANEKDSGNTKVQIALLTERIKQLTEHCKKNKKDASSQRGLIILVGQRRKLLKYLRRRDLDSYRTLIQDLGIRK